MKQPIYLDNHSTTRMDNDVFEAMVPYFKEFYGNASSKSHPYGWMAEQAVENSRNIIARFLNCQPKEIIFTSGTTESNHIAISGIIYNPRLKVNHIITSVTEHSSIINLIKFFEMNGIKVTWLSVDKYGQIDADQLQDSIIPGTTLVSLMTANNEIGTIHPIEIIGEICRSRGAIFHSDAAQAAGKISIDLSKNIDLLSFSAHKNYGPKGIGALYINEKIKPAPVNWGGGQERGLRPGTLNVPGIAGFGKCIEISSSRIHEEALYLKGLRDRLYNGIRQELDDIHLNGHPENRLPNNLNISFPDIPNRDNFLMELRELAFSTGAACSSGSTEVSHVLKAIGLSEELINTSLRFGVGRFNTEEEIDYAVGKITSAVKKVRKSKVML